MSTVKCCLEVSKTCIYGVSDNGNIFSPLCNYLICEGHSRGCSPDECNKYVEIDDEHPRKMTERMRTKFTK